MWPSKPPIPGFDRSSCNTHDPQTLGEGFGEEAGRVMTPQVDIESRLPAGYIPDDAVIRMVARAGDDDFWEALILDFSISGMGDSPRSAVENALEILDDYLYLCNREGKSYHESLRPLDRRMGVPVLLEMIGLLVRSKFTREEVSKREQKYRLPLSLVSSH